MSIGQVASAGCLLGKRSRIGENPTRSGNDVFAVRAVQESSVLTLALLALIRIFLMKDGDSGLISSIANHAVRSLSFQDLVKDGQPS